MPLTAGREGDRRLEKFWPGQVEWCTLRAEGTHEGKLRRQL